MMEEPNPAGGNPTKLYRAVRVRPHGESATGDNPLKPQMTTQTHGGTLPLRRQSVPRQFERWSVFSGKIEPVPAVYVENSDEERIEDEVNATMDPSQWDDPVQTM